MVDATTARAASYWAVATRAVLQRTMLRRGAQNVRFRLCEAARIIVDKRAILVLCALVRSRGWVAREYSPLLLRIWALVGLQ